MGKMVQGMMILTNNLKVVEALEKSSKEYTVEYRELDLSELFVCARDYVHKGYILLTHPLSGSIKPNENPFKTIALESASNSTYDLESLELIEKAIEVTKKFMKMGIRKIRSEDELGDYAEIDLTLISSALNIR